MVDKVLPGNETVVLAPAVEVNGIPNLIGDTLAPIDAPTVAILNKWLAVRKPSDPGAGAGGNISCATQDDLSLQTTDSDRDSDRTICSVGQSEELTFYNFEANHTFFLDEDVHGDGVYNLARDLTRAPDIPYIEIHRIGFGPEEPFALGQEVDLYYWHTDNPVPNYGDGANQKIGQTAIPKNIVAIGRILAA